MANSCGKVVGHIVSHDETLYVQPEPWSGQLVESRFFAAMKDDFFHDDAIASWPDSPSDRWDAKPARLLSQLLGGYYEKPIAINGDSIALPCRCVKKDATWLGQGFVVVSSEEVINAIRSARELAPRPQSEHTLGAILASDDFIPLTDNDAASVLWELARRIDECS